MGREVALALGLLLGQVGCEQAPTADARPTPPLVWTAQAELTLDAQGQSEAVTVRYPAAQRYIALRAAPDAAASGACYRFEPLALVEGPALAPSAVEYDASLPCAGCSETLLAGRDVALAILPTALTPLPPDGALSLRLIARDCALGTRVSRARLPSLPVRFTLASSSEPSVEASAPGVLHLRIAVAAGASLAPALDEALWRGVGERFAVAGVSLSIDRRASIPSMDDLVVHAATDEPLRTLVAAATAALRTEVTDSRHVSVVLLPCLRVDLGDGLRLPYAYTTRLPGLGDAGPSLLLVSSGRCDGASETSPWPAELGAAIVAHELGHHLGLFHTDTAAGRAQAGDDGLGRLMDAQIADVPTAAARFSPSQVTVLRRHPDLVFSR